MLPEPLNTPLELALWSGFSEGQSLGQASVLNGTFELEQFETALEEARLEIYRKTRQKQNDEFEEDRLAELKEAERYLATARLYPNFAARMKIYFPESNMQSVGDVNIGADTPDPYAKSQALMTAAKQIRVIGLELLKGWSWNIKTFIIDTSRSTYPFETTYRGFEEIAHDR